MKEYILSFIKIKTYCTHAVADPGFEDGVVTHDDCPIFSPENSIKMNFFTEMGGSVTD